MRSAVIAIGIAVFASFGLAPPAQASGPGILVPRGVADVEPVGAGFLAYAVCGVTAQPEPGWYPALTSVHCDLNGFSSNTVTAPGAVAVVDVENVTTTPVTLCVHGWAVFSPTVGAPQTVTVDQCIPIA